MHLDTKNQLKTIISQIISGRPRQTHSDTSIEDCTSNEDYTNTPTALHQD